MKSESLRMVLCILSCKVLCVFTCDHICPMRSQFGNKFYSILYQKMHVCIEQNITVVYINCVTFENKIIINQKENLKTFLFPYTVPEQ